MSKIVKEKKWNKVFTVTTEGPCDCLCLGCGTPRLHKPRAKKEIIDDIELGAREGYKIIEIIGGEPTRHPDFFDFLKKSRGLYDNICLTTNGITLADKKFANEIASMVDNINISLYGHNKNIHELWTRKNGSFDKTVQGIKNCLAIKPESTSLTHMVWRKNFPYLKNMVEFDIELGVKIIGFLNIQPVGLARDIYKDVAVPMIHQARIGLDFLDLLDNFESVEFEDYSFCVFSKRIRERITKNVHIVDIAGQVFLNSEGDVNCYDLFMVHNLSSGIDSTIKTQKSGDLIKEKMKNYRLYLGACRGCHFFDKCNGIFNEYIKVFGKSRVEKEIIKIRMLNQI